MTENEKSNLELIINGNKWEIIIIHNDVKQYWGADTLHRKLYICNTEVDYAKEQCWNQYHR